MQSKKSKKIFVGLAVMLIVVIVVVCIYVLQEKSDENLLVYPGNGIPGLSKNKPVKNINIEMQNYFGKYSFLQSDGINLMFNNIPHSVKYQSSLKLNGPITDLILDINLSSGEAFIKIGNIDYKIDSNSAVIYQNDEQIGEDNNTTPYRIEIECTKANPKHDINTRCRAGVRASKISLGEYITPEFPALITIELTKGSSGTIGQWKWQRGIIK